MLEVSASIDAGDVARFDSALKEYATVLGKDMATAPRRAAIQICKSLRAGTRVAPKYARGGEYSATKSDADPKHKWITAKDGRKLRRWNLKRPPRGTDYDVYALNKSDLRKNRLLLVRRGLAKQSWGWVMHNIFNGAAPDTPWQRRKRDQRNPKDATRDSTSTSFVTGPSAGGFALISNRLDYIEDALMISVDDAIRKATNWIMKQVELRRPKV